jgi:DNA-binding transcriptional ArsR family regulator
MVNSLEPSLDLVFSTLAHPTRRAITARLAQRDATASELAAPFDVSLPAISRHLKLLEQARLVVRHRRGRHHVFELRPDPLREAAQWLATHQRFWEDRLDDLGRHLEEHP